MVTLTSVEDLDELICLFYDPKTPQDKIKEIDTMLLGLEKRKETWLFIKQGLIHPELKKKKNFIFQILNLLKTKLKRRFDELEQNDILPLFKLLLEILKNKEIDFKIYSIGEKIIECICLIYPRIVLINNNNPDFRENFIINLEKIIDLELILNFISFLPLIFVHSGIVIDEKILESFSKICYEIFFPQAFEILYKNYDKFQNEINTRQCLLNKESFRIIENWSEYLLVQKIKLNINDFENYFVKIPFVKLSFDLLMNIVMSEYSFNMILQISIYIKEYNLESPLFFKFIDDLIEKVYINFGNKMNDNEDFYELYKYLSFIFRNFLDNIGNKEKLFLLMMKNLENKSSSIESILLAFQKFIKKIINTDKINNYIEVASKLWQKIPLLMKLEQNIFLDISKEYLLDNDYSVDLDDSQEFDLRTRKYAKSLFKYFLFFVDKINILDFICNEFNNINNVPNEVNFEALVYLFKALIDKLKFANDDRKGKKYDEKLKIIISNEVIMKKIIFIFYQICELAPKFSSARTLLTVNKLIAIFLSFNIKEIFDYENFINFIQNWNMYFLQNHKLYTNNFNKIWLLSFRSLIKYCPKEFFEKNLKLILEILNSKYSAKLLENIVKTAKKYSLTNFEVEIFESYSKNLYKNIMNSEKTGLIALQMEKLKVIITEIDKNIFLRYENDILNLLLELIDYNPEDCEFGESLIDLSKSVLMKFHLKNKNNKNFLEKIVPLLEKIIKTFEKHLLPCFMFFFEKLLDIYYEESLDEFFNFYFKQYLEIFLKKIDCDNFDGKNYYTLDNEKISGYSRYANLTNQNDIIFEDLFDDFFGLINKVIKKNPIFIVKSPYFFQLLLLGKKIYNEEYIYTVRTIVPFFKLILHLKIDFIFQNEDMIKLWSAILIKSFNILIEECLERKLILKIFHIICKILNEMFLNIFDVLKHIFENIPCSILSLNEKKIFLDDLEMIKSQNIIISFDSPKQIENFFNLFLKRIKNHQKDFFDYNY